MRDLNIPRRLLAFGASIFGAVLVSLLGWALVRASLDAGSASPRTASRLRWMGRSFAESVARLSYDLPFLFRGDMALPAPACIIYLDEKSAHALGQSMGYWDRKLHTRLVQRLTAEGARIVFFDVVFSDACPEPGTDHDFATAIRQNGHVILGAALELEEGLGAAQERTVPPTPELRKAAAGWGLLAFRPVDADYGVRRIYAGVDNAASATWLAAMKLGGPLVYTPEERARQRWLNYYGPPNFFPNLSYDRALAPDGTPPGFFRDRIVFIGGRSTIGGLAMGMDDFRTPYGRLGGSFSKGVEVHLTAFLNLFEGRWLTRLDPNVELALALISGTLLGGLLPLFRPHLAALLAVLCVTLIGVAAFWMFCHQLVWFAWCVPAFIQAPVALGWAVGTRYFLEERRRNALREAFAHYLSPQMADRIADANFDLAPGGTVMEATVMFTDLENFTSLAEDLDNPQRVSQVLTGYFTQTTRHILENDGTIIKYAGDSVQAAWGVPLTDSDHAVKATLAACRLKEASATEVDGHPLRTRIGLNTGPVLAGNLGSIQRFDYALIGDTVNVASRLEGLNKFLGTDALISEAVRQQLGNRFLTRCVGEFKVAGKKGACLVHELVGLATERKSETWIETFEQGLAAFRKGDLEKSEALMQETIVHRNGADGPARFYLEQISAARGQEHPESWTGIVQLSSK